MTPTQHQHQQHIKELEELRKLYLEHYDSEGTITRALAAAIEGLKERTWKSFDNAPRDGEEVLLLVESRAGIPGKMLVGHWMPGGHCIEDHPPIEAGWYFWNGREFDKASKPLAWMKLPTSPTPISAALAAAEEVK